MIEDSNVQLGQLLRRVGDSLFYSHGLWRFRLAVQEVISSPKTDSSIVVLDGALAAPPFLPSEMLPTDDYKDTMVISGNLWCVERK